MTPAPQTSHVVQFAPEPGCAGTPAQSQLDSCTQLLETSDWSPDPDRHQYFGSVDHHDHFQSALPAESSFRHASWRAPRRRIYQSLLRCGVSCRRSQHFADCGSSLWLMRDGQQLSLSCNQCHDRLCIPCQKRRQSDLIEGILLRMPEGRHAARFVTLTLKHADSPLSVQLTRLISCFKQLRLHPAIAPHLKGGAWFIEVKLSKNKAHWHPHLHVIAEGDFIDAKTLSSSWYEVTGDSYITDIRAIDDPTQRATYVTKYATKPLANEVTLDPAKLDEFVMAIKGRRLWQCFGSWCRKLSQGDIPKPRLTPVGRVSSIHADACAGDVTAMVWMHQMYARWPKLKTQFPLRLPKETGPP